MPGIQRRGSAEFCNEQMGILILTLLAAASAVLQIWAEYHGPPLQIYIFKPLTMVFILLIAVRNARDYRAFYAYAIIAGLLFSLAGDVFLMLPTEQFVAGLVSFLMAHLFYIAAFTHGSRLRYSIGTLLPFVLYGIVIFVVLSPSLGEMKLPVLVYIVVILVMGWQAWERWQIIGQRVALIAVIGAILFIVSDSALAFNRFREPFELARALNLSTYFAAQWFIASSVDARNAFSYG
jgi:uncharacterized membrane protein YhhN